MRPAHQDVHLLELWWQLLWELLDGLQVPHVQRVGVDRHLRHLKSIAILFSELCSDAQLAGCLAAGVLLMSATGRAGRCPGTCR